MFISNSRQLFHLWWKENLVKDRKVSKYYETNCRPNFIKYRNYKNCDKNNFLYDLNNINVRFDKENYDQCCMLLTNSFSEVFNKHASLKKKTVWRNHDSFVNKEFLKAFDIRGTLRNKMCQNPISKNINAYQKQRTKRLSLRTQCIK